MTDDFKARVREAGALAAEVIRDANDANVLGLEQRWFDVFQLLLQSSWAIEDAARNRELFEKQRAEALAQIGRLGSSGSR